MSNPIGQYETVLLEEFRLNEEEPGKIYVIAGTDAAKTYGASVAFHCPCGCGKEIWLPCYTDTERRERCEGSPVWRLEVHADKTVTLTPSILDRGTCGSHYFIQAGKVVWC